MLNVMLVGMGGFLGAAGRYSLGLFYGKLFPNCTFPVNTLSVNVIGAFVMGLVIEYFIKHNMMGSGIQLFVMVGILGGFTTFSSFSLETINLLSSGKTGLALFNILLNVALCLLFVLMGKMAMGKILA